MFNTKGQTVKTELLKKSIEPGIEKAKIYSYYISTAKTGKKQLCFVLEGVHTEGFEGWDIDKENPALGKFKGKSGRVNVTKWLDEETFNNPNISENEILTKITALAQTLGVKDKLDEIDAKTIEEWLEHAMELVNKDYLYWFIAGEESEYNGKIFIKLSLPKYNFASLNSDSLEEFDKNNKYHFKKLKRNEEDDFKGPDLDF